MLQAEGVGGVDGDGRLRRDALDVIVREPGDRSAGWRETSRWRQSRRTAEHGHHRKAALVFDGGQARAGLGLKSQSSRIDDGQRLRNRRRQDDELDLICVPVVVSAIHRPSAPRTATTCVSRLISRP